MTRRKPRKALRGLAGESPEKPEAPASSAAVPNGNDTVSKTKRKRELAITGDDEVTGESNTQVSAASQDADKVSSRDKSPLKKKSKKAKKELESSQVAPAEPAPSQPDVAIEAPSVDEAEAKAQRKAEKRRLKQEKTEQLEASQRSMANDSQVQEDTAGDSQDIDKEKKRQEKKLRKQKRGVTTPLADNPEPEANGVVVSPSEEPNGQAAEAVESSQEASNSAVPNVQQGKKRKRNGEGGGTDAPTSSSAPANIPSSSANINSDIPVPQDPTNEDADAVVGKSKGKGRAHVEPIDESQIDPRLYDSASAAKQGKDTQRSHPKGLFSKEIKAQQPSASRLSRALLDDITGDADEVDDVDQLSSDGERQTLPQRRVSASKLGASLRAPLFTSTPKTTKPKSGLAAEPSTARSRLRAAAARADFSTLQTDIPVPTSTAGPSSSAANNSRNQSKKIPTTSSASQPAGTPATKVGQSAKPKANGSSAVKTKAATVSSDFSSAIIPATMPDLGPSRNSAANREVLYMKWMKGAELKYMEEQEGLHIKTGKYSKDEDAAILRAIEDYRLANGLEKGDIDNIISGVKASGERKNYNEFWQYVTERLVDRPIHAVNGRVKRLLQPEARGGPWSAEEDRLLRNAVAQHGNKWVEISGLVGRWSEDCRDRWRNYLALGDQKKEGPWSQEETAKLIKAVREAEEESDVANRSMGLPASAVKSDGFWAVVGAKFGPTRTRLQMRSKWHDSLSLTVEAEHGETERLRWTLRDTYALVQALANAVRKGLTNFNDIDYYKIRQAEGFTPADKGDHAILWSVRNLQRRVASLRDQALKRLSNPNATFSQVVKWLQEEQEEKFTAAELDDMFGSTRGRPSSVDHSEAESSTANQVNSSSGRNEVDDAAKRERARRRVQARERRLNPDSVIPRKRKTVRTNEFVTASDDEALDDRSGTPAAAVVNGNESADEESHDEIEENSSESE